MHRHTQSELNGKDGSLYFDTLYIVFYGEIPTHQPTHKIQFNERKKRNEININMSSADLLERLLYAHFFQ